MDFEKPPEAFEKPYKARPKAKPQREGSLASLAQVLPSLYERYDLNTKVQEMSLLALWPSLVGERYAALSKATAIRQKNGKTVLMVKVANAGAASDLSFQADSLKTMLNGFAPQTGITLDKIQFTIGSL